MKRMCDRFRENGVFLFRKVLKFVGKFALNISIFCCHEHYMNATKLDILFLTETNVLERLKFEELESLYYGI